MAFTFCGASVRGFSSNIGWNEQASTFRCTLVEDPANGDLFVPPPTGTPIYFEFYALKFFGLLQRWKQTNGVDGFPSFEVEGIDPRQILEGTQIITGSYRGAVNVDNIFNAFGWWENLTGFGSSLTNESGMPWYKILEALNVMSNTVGGIYGNKLEYCGILYNLDLTELPIPPTYYRMPGPSIGLMEAINMVCEDGGYDYYVTLVGNTITVKTTSRVNQIELGTITALQGTGYGVDLMRSSAGLEARNEVTSAFLIGGQQETLHLTGGTAIQPFWGFDAEGAPITGTGDGLAHAANLNAAEIAVYLGDTTYLCSVYEMLAAMDGYPSWSAYISTFRPAVGVALGLNLPVGPVDIINAVFGEDFIDVAAGAVHDAAAAALETDRNSRSHQVWQFVQKHAQEYLGKQFLVSIPFTLVATEPETLRVVHSQEISDGGWLEEGAEPLGLPTLIQDQFKTQNGKFVAYCLYSNMLGVDFSHINQRDVFVGTNGIYVKVQVSDTILFNPDPCVVVTVSNPVFEMPEDGVGGLDDVAGLLNLEAAEFIGIEANIAGGPTGVKLHPRARQPDFMAIPLRSHILTYGPWYAQGAAGKVRFESDSSLTPWNYGGYTLMNLAGNAKVTTGITYLQVVESGDLEFTGPPAYNLGEMLEGTGPNLTSIDVTYGDRGVTTVYRATTFTPRFGMGGFTKDVAKRIERFGRTTAELRKSLRTAVIKNLENNAVLGRAYFGWINNMGSAFSRRSPHTTFIAECKDDPAGGGMKRVAISSATLQEIRNGCGANNDEVWQRTAVMSLTGLLRPFSTNPSATSMAHMQNPASGFTVGINSTNYNPFASGNDINVEAWGNTYQGMNQYRQTNDPTNTRVMSLRGPMMLSGWGRTIDGKVVPGNSDGSPAYTYQTSYMKKSHLFKTGPVDLLWDDKRGVWTSHDILIGKTPPSPTSIPIPARGSGIIQIWDGNTYLGYDIPVYNWFNAGISGSTNVAIGYCVTANKWYVIAADCTS